MAEFQVRRDDLRRTRIVETGAAPEIAEGEILVAIDRFSFTANNVTYGAAGDLIGYWKFFPPTGDATKDDEAGGWGVLPVWGFADVIASKSPEIPVGDRFYGYFPPAAHLKITPTKVTPDRLFDGAEHRAELPQGYNLYRRVLNEPGYDRAADDRRALLHPLHLTSFCIWDALQEAKWHGASQAIIVSASSKTSIGLAYALSKDDASPMVIGLTSPRNKAFVEGLGYYDRCLGYDALGEIDASAPSVIIDMSGNAELLGRMHAALGENMRHTVNVGLTHWDEGGANPNIIQQRSEFFFAPGHIERRIKEWGAGAFNAKSAGFMADSVEESQRWMRVREVSGLAGLEAVYADVCDGKLDAKEGVVVAL